MLFLYFLPGSEVDGPRVPKGFGLIRSLGNIVLSILTVVLLYITSVCSKRKWPTCKRTSFLTGEKIYWESTTDEKCFGSACNEVGLLGRYHMGTDPESPSWSAIPSTFWMGKRNWRIRMESYVDRSSRGQQSVPRTDQVQLQEEVRRKVQVH